VTDVSAPLVSRDRDWFAGALAFRPPLEFLELCALCDGVTVGAVRVYPLAEVGRTPVGDEDDLLHLAELLGAAVFFGVLRSNERDDPLIHAIAHDVPDVPIALGKPFTALVEQIAGEDPAVLGKLQGRTG
jgi:hypothetical protein